MSQAGVLPAQWLGQGGRWALMCHGLERVLKIWVSPWDSESQGGSKPLGGDSGVLGRGRCVQLGRCALYVLNMITAFACIVGKCNSFPADRVPWKTCHFKCAQRCHKEPGSFVQTSGWGGIRGTLVGRDLNLRGTGKQPHRTWDSSKRRGRPRLMGKMCIWSHFWGVGFEGHPWPP